MFAEMSEVTEIALALLKKGINVTDPGSDAYKTLTEVAFRLIKGWEGCQRIFWGVEIEDPNKLRLFVNWNSPEAHEDRKSVSHAQNNSLSNNS